MLIEQSSTYRHTLSDLLYGDIYCFSFLVFKSFCPSTMLKKLDKFGHKFEKGLDDATKTISHECKKGMKELEKGGHELDKGLTNASNATERALTGSSSK